MVVTENYTRIFLRPSNFKTFFIISSRLTKIWETLLCCWWVVFISPWHSLVILVKGLKTLVWKTCLLSQLSLVCRACLFEHFYGTPIIKTLYILCKHCEYSVLTNIYLIGENFVGENFFHLSKISALFLDEKFFLCFRSLWLEFKNLRLKEAKINWYTINFISCCLSPAATTI